MHADKELRDLKTNIKVNPNKIKVFMDVIDFSFGLIHRNTDQILNFDSQVREYQSCREEAIFIMFVGVVNHWVALIAHKKNYRTMQPEPRRQISIGKKYLTKFFLLDSSNIQHLDKNEADLPDLIMDRVREKIKLGLKATSKFQIEMTIQSLFDQRSVFAKLV